MSVSGGIRFPTLLQAFLAVLPDGLQHPVTQLSLHTWRSLGHHQRLIHQLTQDVQHVVLLDTLARAHLFRCLKSPSPHQKAAGGNLRALRRAAPPRAPPSARRPTLWQAVCPPTSSIPAPPPARCGGSTRRRDCAGGLVLRTAAPTRKPPAPGVCTLVGGSRAL